MHFEGVDILSWNVQLSRQTQSPAVGGGALPGVQWHVCCEAPGATARLRQARQKVPLAGGGGASRGVAASDGAGGSRIADGTRINHVIIRRDVNHTNRRPRPLT